MPIYEYRCDDCGKTFEYVQRMTEEPKSVCEACGGALERLISQSAFVLKGGGWYKDLYASPKPGSGSSSGSESKTSESKESKKDSGGSGSGTSSKSGD